MYDRVRTSSFCRAHLVLARSIEYRVLIYIPTSLRGCHDGCSCEPVSQNVLQHAPSQNTPVEVMLLRVIHGLEPLLSRLDIHRFAGHILVYAGSIK